MVMNPSVNWKASNDPDGMELMTEDASMIVTDLAGWYGTPGVDVGDVRRTLIDGMIPGPKTLQAREMTLEGWIIGEGRRNPRQFVTQNAERLDALAGDRTPATLTVGDPWLDRRLWANIRAVSNLVWTWRGPLAMQYQVALRATDPRLYEEAFQSATLVFRADEPTGRLYPRGYPPAGRPLEAGVPTGWKYRGDVTQSSAFLRNAGNVAAPVVLFYTGPLGQTRVTDGERSILLRALDSGENIFVNSETLNAWVVGANGIPQTRNSYVLPGSRPMLVPPRTPAGPGEIQWSLYVPGGTGNIALTWRSAWL